MSDHPAWVKANERDVRYNDREPHGWIQWKGTHVCIDLHCECGFHGHVDGEFFYHWRCPKCDACYNVGQNVRLIKLTPEEIASVSQDPDDAQWVRGDSQ